GLNPVERSRMRSHLKVAVQRLAQGTATGNEPLHGVAVYAGLAVLGGTLIALGMRTPRWTLPLTIGGGLCVAGASAGLLWWLLLDRYRRRREALLFTAEPTWIAELDCTHLAVEQPKAPSPGYRCELLGVDLRAERLCLLCPCYLMRAERPDVS
ncbi:MAG TPA: hypothetical protein VEI97_03265, partial [bacterium]|nr:hypothetical protein [bacterium]